MKMPNPIAIRFAKLIFSILSITVLGVIFAMISHDHKLLILSAGVAITGGVKACSFYRQVSRQQYECLEAPRHRSGAGEWKPRTAGSGWTI